MTNLNEPWALSPLFLEYGTCHNDGSVVVMGGTDSDDTRPVCHVLPTVDFKRGTGHKLKDPVRDEIARFIANAPAQRDAACALLTALKALTEEAHRNMTGGRGHLIDDARRTIAAAEAAGIKAEG